MVPQGSEDLFKMLFLGVENPILISTSFQIVFLRAPQNEDRFDRLVLGSEISETSKYVKPVTQEITPQGLRFRV